LAAEITGLFLNLVITGLFVNREAMLAARPCDACGVDIEEKNADKNAYYTIFFLKRGGSRERMESSKVTRHTTKKRL
jgi:hypothetical protein